MNGAETYTLLLTTVPAEKTTVKDKIDKTATTIPEKLLSDGEQKSLNHIVTNWKDLPDTLPGDTISFRKKYPQMENANNLDNSGKYSMDTQALKDVLTKMSQDSNLIKIINKDTLLYYAKSDNPVFLRALLGTFLALTSGGNVSRKLGLRIGADKNPTTANDVNKYLETPGLIEAELDAINKEYGATGMTKDNLLTLMRFW